MFCSLQPVMSMRQNGAQFLLTIIPLHFYILITLSEFNCMRYELLSINKLDYLEPSLNPTRVLEELKKVDKKWCEIVTALTKNRARYISDSTCNSYIFIIIFLNHIEQIVLT